MQPTFTYKHIQSSPELNAYATKKLSKINKYRDFKFIETKYIFSTNKDDSIHVAELILQIKNDTVSASAEAPNMYQAIDSVIAKISKQLEKKKTHYIKSRHDTPKETEEINSDLESE